MTRATLNKRKFKPSVPNPCSICGTPIYGSFVGTGDGTMKDGGSFAHPDCYWKEMAQSLAKALLAITMPSINGEQVCFRTSNSVPMAMTPRLERVAKHAVRKAKCALT